MKQTKTPENVIVIADTHGQADATEKLVSKLDNRGDLKDRRLVFLGDYIDRGPAIKQLVGLAIDLAQEGHVMLAGNHEYTLGQALDFNNPWADFWAHRWLQNYQDQMLTSYGINYTGAHPPIYWADKLRQYLPQSHFDFLTNLDWAFENDQLVAVHAGLDPNRELRPQTDSLLAKKTDNPRGPEQLFSHELARATRGLGKLVVSGHSARPEPYISPERALIDCGVDRGGRLVAYIADSGEVVS